MSVCERDREREKEKEKATYNSIKYELAVDSPYETVTGEFPRHCNKERKKETDGMRARVCKGKQIIQIQ